MRSVLFHCRRYATRITRLANRPSDINPETVREHKQQIDNCIVAMISIEMRDKNEYVEKMATEISHMAKETKNNRVVILPFAHLSNRLAEPKKGLDYLKKLEESLSKDHDVSRAHFGSHKELMLDLYGHPGNARYREF
ncbi:hypothetical protein JW968_00515 [Candidatus Woesearchaeota archaeon]|nr:hypothetical protein [Candidatus Woesearchaeota archaeon]